MRRGWSIGLIVTGAAFVAALALVSAIPSLGQQGGASQRGSGNLQGTSGGASGPALIGPGGGRDVVPPRIDQFTPTPGTWIVNNVGLTGASIHFTEPVTIPSGSVSVWGVSAGTVSDFTTSYNPVQRWLTITFNPAIHDDRVTVVVDYTVVDLSGNELDGEILNPANASLPSGDGIRGGQAVFRINVLQGDANRDGTVNSFDGTLIQASLGKCTGQPGFNPNADLNGDGCVNVLDVGIYRLAIGRALPAVDGTSPSVAQVRANPPVGFFSELQTVELRFNEPLSPERFGPRSCFLIDEVGALQSAASAVLAADRLSAEYTFQPTLPQCASYAVNISNSLADPSGMLLSPPATAPSLSGMIAPPAPTLDPHPTITNAGMVTITGAAPGGAFVELSGPGGSFQFPVTDDVFSADVVLSPNSVNALLFTTISACGGLRGPPTPTSITHDGDPPTLFIDFPANGADITTPTSDVAGRVSDLLGVGNIAVTVNGLAAEVNVGQGNYGTFFRPAVPLQSGQPTLIEAVATDSLGNERTAQIMVTQVEIPPDSPQMEVLSGNGQTAAMMGLLPSPIVVRVLHGDGTPFVNKVCTFKVTRSDGRLTTDGNGAGSMMLQVHTDASGEALAYWRVGSDAGMGNNRVEVTSTSIAGTTQFCASAEPGPAHQINIGSGNNQVAEVESRAPMPLRAWVNDACNAVPDIPVTFTVLRGNGRVNGELSTTVSTGVTGHAEVNLELGPEPGVNVVEATFAGNPGRAAEFYAVGVMRDASCPTEFTGVVFDNANQPLQNATILLLINGAVIGQTVTDVDGHFLLDNLTASGPAELHVEGDTVTAIGGQAVPAGMRFPALHFAPVVIPNVTNSLPMPVLLPPLLDVNDKVYSGTQTQDLEITCEGIDGLKMIVRAGTTVTLPDGTLVGPNNPGTVTLSLNQVQYEDIPMPMPNGAAPLFAWTFQPGGCHFDRPVEIVFPNMSGLPAGGIAYFLSFNHDTGRFEIVASGRVSDDGSEIRSDPGVGITNSGWGGNCPPYGVTGGGEGEGNDGTEPEGKEGAPGSPSCEKSPLPDVGLPDTGSFGDPVYPFSGEFVESVEDLRIKGRGLDFVWARKYASRRGVSSVQGINWDYSYNIALIPSGNNKIIVCDGNSRRDTYRRQPDGSFTKKGFRRKINAPVSNTPIEMDFPDKGKWIFNPLDGSSRAGKIDQIVDRNGNRLAFFYDATGRLERVRDTLDRDILIAYNTNNSIQSITDFTGRQVKYEYYQDTDAGGSAGDLKSVTTPAVTGTPNGNNFPTGKTTVYTYSKGFAQQPRNRNLLTITDGKGQTYLTNIYTTETDFQAFNFDKVERQIWGDPTDIVDFRYVRVEPTPETNGAFVKAIINDRVGNVGEYFYGTKNRLVMMRQYTGRANPALPTTENENRPSAPLRPDDPPYWETRYKWNSDSLLTRIDHPNGNVTINIYEADINPDAPPRSRANLRQRILQPGPLGGDQAAIVESFEYDDDLPGCCGSNFVKKHTDGRGNITEHDYDDFGNRRQTRHRILSIVEDFEYNAFGQMTAHVLPDNGSAHLRRDVFTYYDSGPQRGYLKDRIIDALGLFALTTTYEYDAVGNVVRMIDPRGSDTQFIVNQLDQVVRSISREIAPGGGVRYQRDTFYDANNNVVRVDVQNVNDSGAVEANTHFTTTYQYDILNYLTRKIEEVDASRSIATEYAYDANRNRTLTRFGEATNGNQPTNVRRVLYDERDLTFQVVRGAGDPAHSTTQYDYDGNKNVVRMSEGLEDAPHLTVHVYDGYNRLLTTTDPMGNLASYHFDANGNRTSNRTDGELVDVPGAAGNVRLSERMTVYDAMDRKIADELQFFDTATQNPIGDGLATAQTLWSDNSQVIRVTNDNNHATMTAYDTANRRSVVTDAKGNTVTYGYDQNSTVTSVVEVEKSDLGSPDEVFTTTYAFDGLDRLISTTDNVGNINRHFYDSRNNRTRTLDALNHEARYVYDGLNRLTATARDMNGNGASITDAADIVTRQNWDDSSRLTGQTDDNGNTTAYGYDALNRQASETYADGTAQTFVLDVHDNRVQTTDGNGTVVGCQYDLLDRQTRKDVTTFGAGVAQDTTFEAFAYDGLSRLVVAEDDDSTVARSYDSLSRVTLENQGLTGFATAVVTSTYDAVGNLLTLGYPGGRVVTTTYDELERKKIISDAGGMIADYDYVGPARVERREYGNGTRTDYTYNGITGVPNPTNDFGVKRVVRVSHMKVSDGTVLDDRTFTWDPMFNKTQRKDIRASGPGLTHDFGYDAAYRLVHTLVTDPAATVVRNTTYNVDGAHNRTSVVGAPDNGDYIGPYTMNASLPEPADLQVNQYTTTPTGGRAYDRNGNVTVIHSGLPTQRTLTYDFRNRMVGFANPSASASAEYRYDALGRRVAKVVTDTNATQTTRFLLTGWQEIEEQDGAVASQATFVFGNYIDEVLQMRRGTLLYWFNADALHNVTVLTDATGALAEQYSYSDFGAASVADAIGNVLPTSAVRNPYLFSGRRLDLETGWYDFRTRYLEPSIGRFAARDVIGIWGDALSSGNGFVYVANNPWTLVDPFGLAASPEKCKRLWDQIVATAASIARDIKSYDPACDIGGKQHKYGVTKPGTHAGKLADKQRMLENKKRRYIEKCGGGGGPPLPPEIEQTIDLPIPQNVPTERIDSPPWWQPAVDFCANYPVACALPLLFTPIPGDEAIPFLAAGRGIAAAF